MSDSNAGKYRRIYKTEFTVAQKALAPYGGSLEWGAADYEAFVYKSDGVQLVFYPHRTSAGNYHIRVRSNGSKDAARLTEILGALRIAAGNNCTFSMKGNFRAQYDAADKIDPGWIVRPRA